MKKLFATMDSSGDGAINFDEFSRLASRTLRSSGHAWPWHLERAFSGKLCLHDEFLGIWTPAALRSSSHGV